MKCRFCENSELQVFLDLGMSPMANSFLKQSELNNAESFYPLCSYFCPDCYLVQLDEFEQPKNIFSNYAYFSSFSDTWNSHIESFVSKLISKFNLSKDKQIIEIASNDGYLLKHFKKHDFPVLGIEPAKNIAAVAESNGISTINKFFGIETAKELSSDGKKIADISKKAGAEVPFIRPKKFSHGKASQLDVVNHTLDFLAKTESYEPDIVTILHPTNPFTSSELLDRSIKKLKNIKDIGFIELKKVSSWSKNPRLTFNNIYKTSIAKYRIC